MKQTFFRPVARATVFATHNFSGRADIKNTLLKNLSPNPHSRKFVDYQHAQNLLFQQKTPLFRSTSLPPLKQPLIFSKRFQNRTNADTSIGKDTLGKLVSNRHVFKNLRLYKPLWESQIEGIDFLVSNTSALIGDEPGLGKTIQAIVAMRLLFHTGEINRALIVVPKSTIGSKADSIAAKSPRQWEGHLHYWAPDLQSVTVTAEARGEAHSHRYRFGRWRRPRRSRHLDWIGEQQVFLTTYNQIRNEIQKGAVPLDHFDLIILDEAHTIKNPYSQTSEALCSLNASYRWGFTGTPVQNKPQELYAILSFLNPETFPKLYQTLYLNLEEERIVEEAQPFFLRRTKPKGSLPPKVRFENWVHLSGEQEEYYKLRYKIRRQRLKDLVGRNSERQVKTSIFGALSDLLQICNFSPNSKESSKIPEVLELCRTAETNGSKTIIFSRFLEFGIFGVHSKLRQAGHKAGILHGQMSGRERNEALELFKTSPSQNILISTVFTGGVGLNLTEASTIIHFDHWWNPAIVWQAEDRAHRFGQNKQVNVHSLFSRGTIEERIFNLLKRKEVMIDRVLARLGNDAAEQEIDNTTTVEELLEIFEL